ncbi:RICIN domain-containing protein [Dactylosporangium sp. NPDC050588]|uniref:RICIN domain-containing protein n=1 Tax=Dactylosporangium sp. NPDC050588 TaxID=3157211 RepID=UPI0033E052B3
MQRRTLLRLGAAGAASVGAASWLGAWQANAGTAAALRAAPSTPFAVGVRQYNWTRGTRRITTFVYYPATGTPGGSPVTNAPVAPGVFPVCAYQHGLGGTPQGALSVIRPLAAAGFIVPAVSVPGVGIGDTYNGELPRDNSEAITRTLALNTTGGDPLAGHIDTTVGVGMSGHSMGGMTTHAMLTAFPDPRIKAAIPMSCVDMGNPDGTVRANVLFVHGDRDPTCPYTSARQAYSELPAAKAFLTFVGGDHGNFFGNALSMRTFVDWMRWSLYGDTSARDRLAADATSSTTRWEFVPGSSEPPPASTYFNLVAQHSGKVAEITGASTAAGAGLAQWTSNGGQHQQFAFIDAGGGYVRIKARHSGLVLQVAGNTSGAAITQQPDTNAAGQQWRLTEQGGTVSLVNRQSGLAMDVWERSTADGARISQYAYSGNPNQRFTRRAV